MVLGGFVPAAQALSRMRGRATFGLSWVQARLRAEGFAVPQASVLEFAPAQVLISCAVVVLPCALVAFALGRAARALIPCLIGSGGWSAANAGAKSR